MPERISRARLERLRHASLVVADNSDAAARQALRSKLSTMRERLLASEGLSDEDYIVPSPAASCQELKQADASLLEATQRLGRLLDDPATPDHRIEASLLDCKIAKLRAHLAEMRANELQHA